MTDYTAIRRALEEHLAREARRAAVAKIENAIMQWDDKPLHREIYYRLNIEAGIPVTGGPTEHQKELARLLQEVSNDGSENEGAIELPQTFCGAVAEEQEAVAADVPAGSRV